MTDDLDDLKTALSKATPAPNAATKASHLAMAQKNFEENQGKATSARLKSDRPIQGLWTGAVSMFRSLTSPLALGVTTGSAVFGLALVVYWNDGGGSSVRKFGNYPAVEEEGVLAFTSPSNQNSSSLKPGALARSRDAETLGATSSGLRPAPTQLASPQTKTQRLSKIGQTSLLAESDVIDTIQTQREAFSNGPSNPLQVTGENPVSTFSVDVDTASYSVIRNSLMRGTLPDQNAVRIEEMVNYFTYEYPAPQNAAFNPTISVQPTPWSSDTQLVHIGIQGAVPDVADRPPLNLVFLIDTSGSMQNANKLPLLKQSFRLMLAQLRPEDQVAIVTYAGSAGQALAPTAAGNRSAILAALDTLQAGGGTAGQAGLQQAYALAQTMTEEGEVSRVILATDGDFNVGISDPEALKTYIANKRETGTYLSVLGFGRGNLNDATMQALAQNGNGQAAYIDTLSEAQKVLVDQLTGALFPIADDVKIQVEFNPAQIAEYRLIGYETRTLRREDFNNDAVDAGDIGAGHSVTALYEVTPVGSDAQLTRPLRYGTRTQQDSADELGFLALRYKAPGEDESRLIEMPISEDANPVTSNDFAAAIAGFGQLLRASPYLGEWSYADAIALATASKGADPFGYRAEAIQLMRLAASLSEN